MQSYLNKITNKSVENKLNETKKVMAIIVTYNRKELLKESIKAVLAQNYKNCEILIVDNASTDGTKEFIKEELKNKKVHYINTGANLGGAGGFNYGMKEAYKLGCDLMWIMDDDCIVHTDSLEQLLFADKELNGQYGFLASKVLWTDGKLCKMNIQKISLSKKVKDFKSDIVKIKMATFVSLLVKSEVVKKIGLPIKDFFIWSDDLEYTRRISKIYNCYLINNSVVTHKSKNNIGSDISKDSIDRLERYNYCYRNEMYLYRKEGIKGLTYAFAKMILHIFRILHSDCNAKGKRIKVILGGLKEGVKFNPKIEQIE